MAVDPAAPAPGAVATPDYSGALTPAAPPDVEAMVRAEAIRQGRDPEMVARLAHQESRFRPDALSGKGAYGVMQLMPGTALKLGVDRYDLADNIKGGVTYLGQQLDRFKDPRLGVAAYNAGPEAVAKYGDVPPYAETQNYVNVILGKGQGAPRPRAADPAAPAPDAVAVPAPEIDAAAPGVNAVATPAPTVIEKLGLAAKKAVEGIPVAADTVGAAAQGAVQAVADPATWPKGNPNSPLAAANAARLEAGQEGVKQGWQQLTRTGPYAPPANQDHGDNGPSDALANLTEPVMGAANIAMGLGGEALSFPLALSDIGPGKSIEALTRNFPHGKIAGLDYDTRLPATFLGDLAANIGGFAEGGAALKPGSGAVVNKATGHALTTGQEAFYKALPPELRAHPENLPPAQINPGDLPAPGKLYVDLEGKLRVAPPETAPPLSPGAQQFQAESGGPLIAKPAAPPPLIPGEGDAPVTPTEMAGFDAGRPGGPPQLPAPANGNPEPTPWVEAANQEVGAHGVPDQHSVPLPEADATEALTRPFDPNHSPTAEGSYGFGPKNDNGLAPDAPAPDAVATPMPDTVVSLHGKSNAEIIARAKTLLGDPKSASDEALADLIDALDEVALRSDKNGADEADRLSEALDRLERQRREARRPANVNEEETPLQKAEREHIDAEQKWNDLAYTTTDDRRFLDRRTKGRKEYEAEVQKLEADLEAKRAAHDALLAHADAAPADFHEAPFGPEPVPREDGAVEAGDHMDAVLDALRAEKSSKPFNGPRLTDMLIKAGGLKDETGVLADMDLRSYGARGGRLINKSRGMSLEAAAQKAQEEGYIGRPVQWSEIGAQDYATGEDLLNALHKDLAGEAVHSRLHEPRADAGLRARMVDLHGELAHHGIDISLPNHEIRALLRDGWTDRDLAQWEHEQALGLDPAAPAADQGDLAAFDSDGPVFGIKDKGDEPPAFDPARAARIRLLDAGVHGVDVVGHGEHGPIVKGDWPAVRHALETLQDGEAPDTLAHPVLGGVDVVYGNKRGGLAHINDKHPGEIGDDFAQDFAGMRIVDREGNRVRLQSDKTGAVVSLDYAGATKRWLLTAYELDKSRRSPGDDLQPMASRGRAAQSPDQPAGGKMGRDTQDVKDVGDDTLDVRPGELLGLRDKPEGAYVPRAGASDAQRGAATSVPELIEQLARATDTTHRQGRMTKPEPATQGQYKPSTGVARTRGWGQIDYAAHEFGHHLDAKAREDGPARAGSRTTPTLRKAIDDHEAELIPMDYVHDRPAAAAAQARARAERGRRGEYDRADEKADQKRDPLLGQRKVDHAAREKSVKAAGDKAAAAAEARARKIAKAEGFAEFFRQYVTNREAAQRNAPKFFAAFEKALKFDNPKMLKAIQKVGDAYEAHLKAPTLDRMRASIHPAVEHNTPLGRFIADARKVGTGNALKAWWVKTVGDWSDPASEFKQAQRMMQRVHWENTGKPLELEGRGNPLMVFRTVRTAAADGFANLWHGIRRAGEDKASGPSLKAALEKAYGKDWGPEKRGDFSAYLIARRLQDEWARFKAGKLKNPPSFERLPAINGLVKELEADNPSFREAGQMFSDYAKAEMQLDVENGLMSPETYQALVAERPFYAPMNRKREAGARSEADLSDAGETANDGGGNYKQAVGSFRDFLDPVQVTMRRALTQATLRRFNMGVKAMAAVADDVGTGGGRWFERVPNNEISAYNVAMDTVLDQAAKFYKVDPEDLRDMWQSWDIDVHPADTLTFFKNKGTSPRGENMVFGWEGGKRFAMRMGDGEGGALALEFMAGLSKDVQEGLTKVAGKGTALTRFGVTGAPAWALTNAIKDAFDVWYKVPGALPFVTTVNGLVHVLARSPTARSFERFARIKAGVAADAFEHSRLNPDQTLLKKGVPVIRHFTSFKAIARLAEFSELATRVGVYKVALKQAQKLGLDPESAAIHASNVSADYMPFDVYGRKTAATRKWVAFVNAWQKGMATLVETAVPGTAIHKWVTGEALTRADKEALYKSGRYAFMIAVVPSMLSAIQESLYQDDPDFREINPYFRATNWMIKAEDLGVPKSWQHWTGKWVRVPKTFEHTAPADVGERIWEATRPDHPERADQRALGTIPSELWTVLGPPDSAFFLSPYLQMKANRDFNGKPIIPDWLMGQGKVDPELQVNSYTSSLSKALSHEMGKLSEQITGQKLTFSPALADHWITAFGGTQARDLLAESSRVDAALQGKQQPALGPEDEAVTSRFALNPARSSKSGADFWSRMGSDAGTYTGALGNFNIQDRDQPAAAIAGLQKQSPDVRDYVLAQKFGSLLAPGVPGGASMLHPMAHAQALITVISKIRSEVRDGAVANLKGAIPLTPDQRKSADDALSHLEMVEMHDAMIHSGVPQYANEKPVGSQPDLDRLAKVDPGLLTRFQEETRARKIVSDEVQQHVWPQLQTQLRLVAKTLLPQATEASVTRGQRGKYDELIRQNEAVLAH